MRTTLAIAALATLSPSLPAASRNRPARRRRRRRTRGARSQARARIAIAPDGVHVQYRVYGAGEPALVFIHGWSCDSNYWREQLPAFKTEIHAGHGRSARAMAAPTATARDWSIARFGQDVATALSAVPNKQIILGRSLAWAARWPSKPRGCSRAASSASSASTPSSRSARRSPARRRWTPSIKPFEADFIGHTRSLVADHLFVKGANPQLAQKIAYDMSLSPPRVAMPVAARTARVRLHRGRSKTSRCPSSPSTPISASR